MRKMQNQMAFDDLDNTDERMLTMQVGQIVRGLQAASTMRPTNRSDRLKLICMECGSRFRSANQIPTCPGCGGSDVELMD